MVFPLSGSIAFYAEKERIKALQSSTVKVKAHDVVGSIKVLAYISTYPIYVGMFSFLFNCVLKWYYHISDANYYTFIFFILFPIIQLISIRSHDGARTHFSDF